METSDCNTKRENQRLPVAEHFYSLQGEGYNCGKAAYFIRLAGCNVRCNWCDSKESWDAGGALRYSPSEIAEIVEKSGAPNVVITGGEPLMHNLDELCSLLGRCGRQIWLETSGTSPLSGRFDWIALSPKRGHLALNEDVLDCANELKVVIGGDDDFEWAEQYSAKVRPDCRLYLQPQWEKRGGCEAKIVEYIKKNPCWQLSLQTHKFLKIR